MINFEFFFCQNYRVKPIKLDNCRNHSQGNINFLLAMINFQSITILYQSNINYINSSNE